MCRVVTHVRKISSCRLRGCSVRMLPKFVCPQAAITQVEGRSKPDGMLLRTFPELSRRGNSSSDGIFSSPNERFGIHKKQAATYIREKNFTSIRLCLLLLRPLLNCFSSSTVVDTRRFEYKCKAASVASSGTGVCGGNSRKLHNSIRGALGSRATPIQSHLSEHYLRSSTHSTRDGGEKKNIPAMFSSAST